MLKELLTYIRLVNYKCGTTPYYVPFAGWYIKVCRVKEILHKLPEGKTIVINDPKSPFRKCFILNDNETQKQYWARENDFSGK